MSVQNENFGNENCKERSLDTGHTVDETIVSLEHLTSKIYIN